MSADDEKVLSQADVDALVALVPTPQRVTPPSVNAAPAPVERPVHLPAQMGETIQAPATASSSPSQSAVSGSTGAGPSGEVLTLQRELAALQRTVVDLTRQVGKYTGMAQRLDSLEENAGHFAQMVQRTAHNNQPSGKQIAELQTQIWELSQTQNRGNELRENFECPHCKAKGKVAFLTKCTACGKERWFGWFPKKNNYRT